MWKYMPTSPKRGAKLRKNIETNACFVLNINFLTKKIIFVRAVSKNICIFAHLIQRDYELD
jgi:hypothetical protein